MCIEHACCSGVDKRSNLTAAEVGANMILAPLQCGVRRDSLHPGTYRMERALLKPTSPEAKSVNHSTAATCALEVRVEARSYTQFNLSTCLGHSTTRRILPCVFFSLLHLM